MISIRKLSYVAAVAAIATLSFHGCSKDEGGAGASKLGKLPGGKSGFAIMDKNSNIVAGVNVTKLTGSEMWKTWGSMAKSQLPPQFQKMTSLCGWDPLTKIDSVIMAGNDDNEDAAVMVVKGITRGEAIACGKSAAAAEGEQVTFEDVGNLTKVIGDGKTGYFGWIDDKTAVIAPGKMEDKSAMEGVMGGKGGLDGNKEIMNLLGNVDTKATLWGVYQNNGNASGGPVEFTAAYGSVNIDSGVKLDIGLRQKSPEEAQATVAQAKEELSNFEGSPVGKFAAKLSIKANGSDVIAQISLTSAEIQELGMVLMSDPRMQGLMRQVMGGM